MSTEFELAAAAGCNESAEEKISTSERIDVTVMPAAIL